MPDGSDEELGPIEWLVVELPSEARWFDGAMAAELATLVDTELIRIIDLVVVDKAVNGEIDVIEFEDVGERHELRALEGQLAEVLALADIKNVAEAMTPGSTAGVLVWENTWAAPFGTAARSTGGQVIAAGQIPTQALIDALVVESPRA